MLNEGEEVGNEIHLASRFMQKIEGVLKHGLPDAFEDFKDFLRNSLTELPWQIDKFKKAVEWIKSQDQYQEIINNIKHNFDFNLDKLLDAKVVHMEKELKV
jgi:hypothetical protein